MQFLALALFLSVFAGSARAATLDLVSASDVQLSLSISASGVGSTRTYDLSSRVAGSLGLQPLVTPLGTFQSVELELSMTGDPIVVATAIPGTQIPMVLELRSITWTMPVPGSSSAAINLTPSGMSVQFPATSVALSGVLQLGSLTPTPFDRQSAATFSGLTMPVQLQSDGSIMVGWTSPVYSPPAALDAYWIALNLIPIHIEARLTTRELVFAEAPEPGAAALGLLTLSALALRRARRAP